MKLTVRTLFLLLLVFGLVTAVFAQEEIEVGDTVEDEADGDVVEYEIELSEGDVIIIDLQSDDFDTIVRVLDEDGDELDMDDDGGDEGFNSLLEFEAEDDGTYTIVVDAFGGEPEGDYTLSVEGAEAEEEDDDNDEPSGDVDLGYGDEIDFDVDGEDELEVTFEGEEGDAVTIIARSDADQDVTVALLDPDGDEVAIFDSFTFGDPALIRIPLESDGVYTIVIEERNGEELEDEVEIELIETEVLDLGDGEQTVEVTDSFTTEYMVFEAEEDVVYYIYVTLDGDISSTVNINLFQEDDSEYSPSVAVGVAGIDGAFFVFEADDDGLVTVEVDYFAFSDSELEVTIELEVAE